MYSINITVKFNEKTGLKECVLDPLCYGYGFKCFNDRIATIQIPNGKYIFVNPYTKTYIPYEYYNAGCFGEGLAPVQLTNEKWIFIDKTGIQAIPFEYDEIKLCSFNEGLSAVQLLNGNSKWIFIDKTGCQIIPYEYDDILENFKNGISKVLLNGEEFYINKNGNRIN